MGRARNWAFIFDAADPRHGSENGYRNLGCRCDPCRDGHADYQARVRSERAERLSEAPHGTESGYTNWRCRCDACRGAHRLERRRQAQRRRAA